MSVFVCVCVCVCACLCVCALYPTAATQMPSLTPNLNQQVLREGCACLNRSAR